MLYGKINTACAIVVLLLSICLSCSTEKGLPPVADKKPVIFHEHGVSRTDNYYWLHERTNPDVLQYLKDENRYTYNWFAPLAGLQKELFNEFTSRINQEDSTVPFRYNGYYFYTRYEPGKEYPVYCRKKTSAGAREEVMMNVNELAGKHNFCSILTYSVSPDNRYFAFSLDTIGRREYTIGVLDLNTRRFLPDALPVTTGNPIWASDNKTIFYSRIDTVTLRSCYIYRHTLGTDPASDILVYVEKDPRFEAFVYKTKSDQFLVIYSFSKTSCEYRILEANQPGGTFRIFSPRRDSLEYDIDHDHNRFLIRANLNAENFRILETPVSKTSIENWKEIVPASDSIFIEAFDIFDHFMVLQERRQGLVTIDVIDTRNGKSHLVKFEEEAFDLSIGTNMEMNTDLLRLNYSSLTTPPTVYEYNMSSHNRILVRQEHIPGGFDSRQYVAERIRATAPDGTMIPISLVYRKDLYRKDMPLLLYGYGAYGNSTDPDFNQVRFSLLDRGFIFAIAHVRGGSEMGRKWYEEGKMLHKKNTFTDFIACADYLVANNYTSPSHLFAMGRSAGGLLMGAIANMRPDLFRGIVAGVPFVDIVTTMLDESIPLTTAEYEEWGNPKIKEYFDYMLSYSPYDNVKATKYPAIFVSAGLHDSQVQYWEPAKWVAKLRATKTDHNPLLLYTNMDAGHVGSSGRFEKYQQTAMEYAFLLHISGIQN